jgi:hypothetical protein
MAKGDDWTGKDFEMNSIPRSEPCGTFLVFLPCSVINCGSSIDSHSLAARYSEIGGVNVDRIHKGNFVPRLFTAGSPSTVFLYTFIPQVAGVIASLHRTLAEGGGRVGRNWQMSTLNGGPIGIANCDGGDRIFARIPKETLSIYRWKNAQENLQTRHNSEGLL